MDTILELGRKRRVHVLPRQMGHFRAGTPSQLKKKIHLFKGSVGHLSWDTSQLVCTSVTPTTYILSFTISVCSLSSISLRGPVIDLYYRSSNHIKKLRGLLSFKISDKSLLSNDLNNTYILFSFLL